MEIYWKDGFYDCPIEGGVEITEDEWRNLLAGQSAGKEITTDADGRPVLTDPVPELPAVSYERQVEALIRERYSLSDELAILRQRDVKPDEFEAYNAFCEACKLRAKQE